MLQHIRVYLTIVILSTFAVAIPIFLESRSIVGYKLSFVVAVVLLIIILVGTVVYISKRIEAKRARLILNVINPSIYYLLTIVIVFLLLRSVEWGKIWGITP